MFDRQLLLQHIHNHDINTKDIRESSWQTMGLGGGGFAAGDPGAPMQGHMGHPSDMRDKMQYKFKNGVYTFPISLHPEKGWVYGNEGGRTTEITSKHPPETIGIAVADGHPQHLEMLSKGRTSKLEEQSLINYAKNLATRSKAKFGSPTQMRATGSNSSVAVKPGYGSSNILFSRNETSRERFNRNWALDRGLRDPDRLNFVQGRWQRGKGDGTRLVFKGGKWQRIPIEDAAKFIRRTAPDLNTQKMIDRYGT